MKLIKTSKLVEEIMRERPRTRSNDDLLYIKVCERINASGIYAPLWKVLLNRNDYGFPPFETVRRARQKVQEKHPELGADVDVLIARTDNEEVFREFARR